MYDAIKNLDDATALRILSSFAQANLRRGSYETQLTPEICELLLGELGVTPMPGGRPSQGEIAREALLVLAVDPQHSEVIRSLLLGPAPEKLVGVETIALAVAVMLVLQTHVRFERAKDGRFTLKIEKKPTSSSLLKPLLQKLMAFTGIFPEDMASNHRGSGR